MEEPTKRPRGRPRKEGSQNVGTSDGNQPAAARGASRAAGPTSGATGLRDQVGARSGGDPANGQTGRNQEQPVGDAAGAARGNDTGDRDPERIVIADSAEGSDGRGGSGRGGGGGGIGGYLGDLLSGRSRDGGRARGPSSGKSTRPKAPRLVVTEPDPRIVTMLENGLTFATGVLASLRPPPLNELWTIAPAEVHAVAEPAAVILQSMPEEWINAVEAGSPYAALGVAVFSIVYPRILQERAFWANVAVQQRAAGNTTAGAPVGGIGWTPNGVRPNNEPHDAGTGSADPLSMFQ